ncbi:hypothetical protein LF1_03840 [Rubripirellula obstinata]|uniref:Uncharacterized protein n=1 Tax=Rubripirellula obstinata TaxID=406547 RepID=A0A5B1CEY0_9BACT|nr:hypothetical protein LF1_03840 [Rubripirellula obstinata]
MQSQRFSGPGIAPRVVLARTRGAMPTRLNNLEILQGVGHRPARPRICNNRYRSNVDLLRSRWW